MFEEDLLEDLKDIEIIEFNSLSIVIDSSVLLFFGFIVGLLELCMFILFYLNWLLVEEKLNVV